MSMTAPSANSSLTTMAFSEGELAAGVTRWIVSNFGPELSDAVRSTPFTAPLLCAIACREAGAYWLPLTAHMSAAQILGLCVYDASGDFPGTSRSAFPANRAQFQLAYGETFTKMLVDEANKARAARGLSPAQYLYKGYGLFQYDLQFVRSDQVFFQSKLWYNFTECVSRAVAELKKTYAATGDIQDAVRAYNGSGPNAEQYARDVMRLLPFCEEAATPPAAASSATFQASPPVAATFTVRHGKRYRATITLSGIQQFASNAMVEAELAKYGFADIVVSGFGASRTAEGTWTGPDTTAQIDSRLSGVVEIPATAPAAVQTDAAQPVDKVAAPVVISHPEQLAARSVRSGRGLAMSNVFTTASLPGHHEGMLVVKVRDESLSSAAPLSMSAASLMSTRALSTGMDALEFYQRAGKIKHVTPLRRQSEGATHPLGISAASALIYTPPPAGPNQSSMDTSKGISFIQLQPGQDLQSLQTALANDPNISSVSKVPARYLVAQPSGRKAVDAGPGSATTIAAVPPASPILWNLLKISWGNARARPGFRDADAIQVAVMDTGVDENHPGLQGRIAAYHWQNSDIALPISGQDLIGHGTHVSGTVAAIVGSASVKGICRCQLNVWKIFSDAPTYNSAVGAYYYYVDPIMYRRALAACVENPVDVVNLSIGGTEPPDPTTEGFLFEQLIASGVTICAAMGNDRESGSPTSYPAAIPGVIAVGATGIDDIVTVFSNSGNHIALSAPGKAIWSTLPTYPGQTGFNAVIGPDGQPQQGAPISRETNYDAWDGTSMATPHVTGSVALLLANRSSGGAKLSPAQVKSKLMQSADKVQAMNGSDFSADYGAGRLNLLGLVESASIA